MPGTGLANFREQYPQYSDLDDEQLGELVREKWYTDMDPDVYRDSMGLPPPPAPPKEPTLWDRVTSIFDKDESKPAGVMSDGPKMSEEFSHLGTAYAQLSPQNPDDREDSGQASPLLRDQFFAGWDEYRSNRATSTALGAIDAYERSEAEARGAPRPGEYSQFAGVGRVARNARAKAGDVEAQAQIQVDITSQQARQTEILQAAIDKRAELMERTRQVPYSQATQEMLEAKGFGESMGELADDPMQIMAEISLRSLPNMIDAIPLMVAGGIAGGPIGFAVGAGTGSGMTEYRASLADSLQQQGVDLTSAESMIAAANNPEIMAVAHNYAQKRAAIIGTVSAISGGLASKPLTPFVKNAVARELSNVVLQTGAQAVLEGSGEALAQLATDGEISGGEVLAEAIGGSITAPVDVGIAAVTGVRAQRVRAEVARVESEVNEMLSNDVPRETETPAASTEPTPEYPTAPRDRWHAEADYETRGGELTSMTPQEFLEQAAPLEMDELTRENVDLLKQHIQEGGELDPLTLNDGERARDSDGRHRAIAAQELGIQSVPVVSFRTKPEAQPADQLTYADDRLQSRQVREQLLVDVGELGNTLPARRAQIAVERAVTGRTLSPGQQRVVSAMLDTDPLAPETADVLDSRQPTDPGDPRDRADRRQEDRREMVRRLSLDELVEKIYTDKLTGIANLRAFEENEQHHTWLAEIDVDSLKFINDNMGETAGDAMLKAVAEALEQADVEAYRIGGDEFFLGGDSKESVQAAAELAKSILSGQQITDGKSRAEGIGITYGLGQTREVASATMKEHKVRRETEGKRSPRGVAPSTYTQSRVLDAKPVDMAPGTNYVSMIGHRGSLPIDANNNLVLGNGRAVRIPKVPVRREHILAVMQKAFGTRIYQGRVRGKMRLGFYRPGQGEIRIKNANDIEVAAHEVAHWLDDRYPWIANLYQKFGDEVKSVSYDVTMITEGWAEFMRLYMTQEHMAMQRTPAFYDAFQKELAKHPKLEATVHDLQELMHAWTQQGARARQASKHGATDASVIEKISRYFNVPLLQSALDGLRRVKEIGLEVAGVDLAYRKLRLALGGANGVLQSAMFYGTPGWREDGRGLEFTGESLKDIFGKYWGDERTALYMMARRGQELSNQGRENLQRADEIAAGLSYADDIPELPAMFERFQAFNQRMLDFAEGSGILGADTRAAIEEMNKNYVPFHRVIESDIDGRGVRTGGNPFQRLKGGTQNVANIWDNIVNNNGMMIRMAMVNDGKRSLLSILGGTDRLGAGKRDQAAGKYAAPITTREAPVNIQSSQVVRKVVEAMGISWDQYTWAKEGLLSDDPDQARLEQGVVESVARMQAGLGELTQFWQMNLDPVGQTDYYLEDGKKVWFEIADAGLYDSLQYLQPKGTNLVLQILGGFSATLRRGVVAVPVFQVKNFARDTTNAWLLSDHVKVPAARALRAVFSKIESDPAYQEMFLNGGGFANRAQGLQAQRKIIVNPTKLTAIYDRFMGRFENANRLAEYKAAREAGESPRRAALLSREISTDFAMRGSSEIARYIAISVPFLNARAQGNYRIARQFDTKDHALSYATRGAGLAVASIALYALNKDDDRYKELPDDIRDLNWVIFTGDGEDDYFLIPKPFESGMLFGTIPERLFEYTETENGKEFTDAMAWMFLQTFSMDMVPQVFQPEVDIQKNKNFAGSPIIPFYLENVEPSQQFTYYTSEAARMAGQAMGISPIKLEHRIRGYLGTMGTYLLGASDAMIRAATDPDDLAYGEKPTRGDTWKENIIVRGLIDPLVGEGPPRRTKYVTDLYNMIREASLVANSADLMIRRQNDQVEEYLNDPEKAVELASNPALQEARASLNEIRKQMDLVRMDRNLTGDQKRAKLWELTRGRNAIARDTVLAIQEDQDRIELELSQRAAGAQ